MRCATEVMGGEVFALPRKERTALFSRQLCEDIAHLLESSRMEDSRYDGQVGFLCVMIDPAEVRIGRGDTLGVFQFESPGMQTWLKRLQPNSFDQLVAMNALYRPGPMERIPSFIARSHGAEPVAYDHAFCKSHAVGYTKLAYQSAYLKAHYPAAFLCALASKTIGRGAEALRSYIPGRDVSGITMLRPDINASDADFSVEKLHPAH